MTVAPTSVRPGPEQHRLRWLLVVLTAFLLGALAVALLYHYEVVGSSSSGSSTEGSGVAATQVRHVAPFTGVELAGSNNVVIRVGGKQSVVVRADDNLVDRVTTEVHSGTLVISNRPGSFTTRSPMSVEVAVPSLRAVTLTGSGTFSGKGTATRLDVTVTGSGAVRFTELVAQDVRALVSGSGSIFVTATRSLDARVSGSGAILYTGNPARVTKNVTGSGAISGG